MPAFFSRLLGALLLCTLLGAAVAQMPAPAAPVDTDTSLDRIRQQIDSAQRSLANPDKLGDADLQTLRNAALAAQQQAADIADQLAPQLAGIDARVAELGTPAPGTKEDPDVASQRALLAKSRGTIDSQARLARLLAVENQQLATQLGTLRRSQFQARLGERTSSILGTTFWSELREDLPADLARVGKLGAELGVSARDTPIGVWLLAPLVIAGIGWALAFARSALVRWLTTRTPSGRLRRTLHALLVVLQWTLTFGVAGIVLFAAFGWNDKLSDTADKLVTALTVILWLGGFVFGLGNALICASRPSWRLLPIPDEVATRLRAFPALIAFVTVAAWLAERVASIANVGLSTTVAINCIVALAIGLTVVLALMRGERIWRLELAKEGAHARPTWLAIAAGLNWLVLATAVVCLLAGYVAFGSFAVKQVVWAGMVLGSAYLLAALIDDVLMAWLASGHHDDAPATGPHATRTSAQVAVLVSGLLRLALLLVALMLLLAPFGEGPADLLRRSGQWTQGIAIGEFQLQPAAVLQALFVLVVGLGVVRLLKHWLGERYLPTTALDPGMRVSATSLFGYAGVVVAVALAMSAMGIGLERIAWVASALSVGIGFGLQAVVQNFVSGLILLAERPVKVGDWVSLGGVEGDIRRINVRATEIQMGDRSTVIVPNSEFITKVVRNVTLADPLGLVQLKLPVPLGSDAQRVRELLLQAFDAEGEVLDTPAPAVLLDGVEHGQLLFNATGYVNSPRMAARVRSALLFDVLNRLQEAGITLSSPPTMLIGAPVAPAADAGIGAGVSLCRRLREDEGEYTLPRDTMLVFRQLFDPPSSTYTYLLGDTASGEALLIDPVFEHVRRDTALLRELGLRPVATLETHVHADHVTGAWSLKADTGSRIMLSEAAAAANADRLLRHGDRVAFGSRHVEARATPGHTGGCLTYVLDDHSMAFTGDSLLIRGCGRTDFQQGSPAQLYRSVREQILSLPAACLLYPAHDYRGLTVTSVAEEQRFNPRLGGDVDEADFTGYMNNLGLPHPKLMDIAVPANLRCGQPDPATVRPEEPSWAPLTCSFGGVWEIQPAALEECIAGGRAGAIQVIDVREPAEFNGGLGHIRGARLLPLAELAARSAEIDTARPIVTVCRSGARSAQATVLLQKSGFSQVANLAGGMLRWRAEALPVARGAE